MSDIIKFPAPGTFPGTTDKLSSPPTTPLISLAKATSFAEYNNQFLPLHRQEKVFTIKSTDDDEDHLNDTQRQRVLAYLNRDNAEVALKNRLIIAHKMPNGEVKQWSRTTFYQFYHHETVLFTNYPFSASTVYIAKLWLHLPDHRRYNSYDEYLRS
jgi:hypothetical protein